MSVATKVAMPFEVAKALLAGCSKVDSEIDPWTHGRTSKWFPRDRQPEELESDRVAYGASYGEFHVEVSETDKYARTKFHGSEARNLTFAQ